MAREIVLDANIIVAQLDSVVAPAEIPRNELCSGVAQWRGMVAVPSLPRALADWASVYGG